jgi:hypothetical protein
MNDMDPMVARKEYVKNLQSLIKAGGINWHECDDKQKFFIDKHFADLTLGADSKDGPFQWNEAKWAQKQALGKGLSDLSSEYAAAPDKPGMAAAHQKAKTLCAEVRGMEVVTLTGAERAQQNTVQRKAKERDAGGLEL